MGVCPKADEDPNAEGAAGVFDPAWPNALVEPKAEGAAACPKGLAAGAAGLGAAAPNGVVDPNADAAGCPKAEAVGAVVLF